MTNGFTLNHDKSLQIYFFVKHQAKNDFLKDVECTVVANTSNSKQMPNTSHNYQMAKLVTITRWQIPVTITRW